MYAGGKRDVLGDTYPTVSSKKGKIIHYAISRSGSLLQACKRAQLQIQICLQCGKATMRLPNQHDYGWIRDEENNAMVPVWFTGAQLPTSLLTKKSRKGNICIVYECKGEVNVRLTYIGLYLDNIVNTNSIKLITKILLIM